MRRGTRSNNTSARPCARTSDPSSLKAARGERGRCLPVGRKRYAFPRLEERPRLRNELPKCSRITQRCEEMPLKGAENRFAVTIDPKADLPFIVLQFCYTGKRCKGVAQLLEDLLVG
jgi:hypothetical protein